MLLPNVEHAFIDIRKLADYSLDPTHPVGRHKSIVFRSALGLTAANADTLREIFLQAALIYDSVPGRRDEFGQRYTVDFPVSTTHGTAILRSAWIVRHDEDFPRLVTCLVLSD